MTIYSKNGQLFSVAAFICMNALNAAPQKAPDCIGPETMRASVRHIESRGIGYNKGYSSLDLFIAPPNDMMILPFIDLRGHVFNNGNWAANAGVGIRGIPKNFSTVLGINAYYDWRNTTKKSYNQGSLGIEALGPVWEFRANGYLPFGTKKSRPFGLQFHEFKGHNIIAQRQLEFAMWGVDAEAGAHFAKVDDVDFYAAAGPYYFSGQVGKNAVGGKVRLWAQWKDYIRAEIMNSYDSVFNEIVQGQVIFSYPFGPKPKLTRKVSDGTCPRLQLLAERKVQRVERQEIIVVDRHKQHRAVKNPTTGLPFQVFFVDNTSHSLGTAESPFSTLAQAQAASGPNDIIYLFAGDGSSTGTDTGITLQDGQKLFGSGSAIPLQTTFGMITIPSKQGFPIITNANTANPAVVLADNNEIAGLQIGSFPGNQNGTLATAIAASTNTSTLNIHNNNILNATDAVDMTATTTAQNTFIFSNNTFVGTANSGSAIILSGAPSSNQVHTVTNNTFLGSWNQLVALTGNNNTQSFIATNNTFVGATTQAFSLLPTNGSLNLTITDNSLNINSSDFVFLSPLSSIVDATITRNEFTAINSTSGSIIVNPSQSTIENMSITDNSFINGNIQMTVTESTDTTTISGNTFNSDGLGPTPIILRINGVSTLSGQQTITIANNNISQSQILISSDVSPDATQNIHILGNVLSQASSNGVFVLAESGSNICLQLENNVSDNIYSLEQETATNFNVQTPVNNSGAPIVTQGTIIFNESSCP